MKLKKILIAIFVISQCSLFSIVDSYGNNSNRIAIVVNKYLKPEIETNLNIYLSDLRNEGYEPVLKEWDLENSPAPQDLKGYLKGLYLETKGLQGAVFIGDLPIPIMQADPILENASRASQIQISDGYIAEKYYMDLVGKEWVMKDADYKFEAPDYQMHWAEYYNNKNRTPEMLKEKIENEDLYPIPEIWTSRIVTSSLTGHFKKTEAQLVNAYLEKNHLYRTGEVVFQRQNLLYSPSIEMAATNAYRKESLEVAGLLSNTYKLIEPMPEPSTVTEFFKPLENESYEIFFWKRHGMKTFIYLPEILNSYTLADSTVNISTAFVFPLSCWIGHYVEPGFFAGAFVFKEQFFVLNMSTGTLPLFPENEYVAMRQLLLGDNIGSAFKEEILIPYIFPSAITKDYYTYIASNIASMNSRYILGDGTLKLQSDKFNANENNSPESYLKKKYPLTKEDIIGYVRYIAEYAPDTKDIEKLLDAETVDQLIKTAFAQDNVAIMDFIIKKATKTKDENGNTFLHMAAQQGKDKIMEYLIKSGFDVKTENNLGETAWDIAKATGRDVNFFRKATEFGTDEQVKFLVENGANVDQLLKAAFSQDNVELLDLIIKKTGNIESKDENGNTFLHRAVQKRANKVIEYLIRSGFDVKIENNLGETAWDIAKATGYFDASFFNKAVKFGSIELIKYLIENGADVNDDSVGYTPLLEATVGGNIEVVRLLIESGANVNEPESQPPLLNTDNIEIIKLLVNNGANIDAAPYGVTALDKAITNGNTEVIEFLNEHGANQGAKNEL